MSDHAAKAEEIAAHFPVPNNDVADQLVNLLLPLQCTKPEREAAA